MQGLRLDGKKQASLNPWSIKRLRFPSSIRIPLKLGSGDFCVPLVGEGDMIEVGQKVARPLSDEAVPLFSGIAGKVRSIQTFPEPDGGFCDMIEIEPDRDFRPAPYKGVERSGWQSMDPETIIEWIREAGVTDMEPEVPSLARRLTKARHHPIMHLIINGCESEPYVTSAHSLMMSHPVEILKGAEILRQALGAHDLEVAIQDDKLEVAELLKSKVYFLKWNHAEIKVLPSRYPQGLPLPLVRELHDLDLTPDLKRLSPNPEERLSRGNVHRALIERGIFMLDVGTAYAVYEAVVMRKPLFERVVTVGGECVIEPRNFWLPLGTSVASAFKAARGLMREPGRMLLGGPMRGFVPASDEVPVLGGVTAVLGLPRELTKRYAVEPCNHCNDCVAACPAEISPVMITLASERGLYDEARHWGADACLECGNCTYVCPAHRPMADLIHLTRSSES